MWDLLISGKNNPNCSGIWTKLLWASSCSGLIGIEHFLPEMQDRERVWGPVHGGSWSWGEEDVEPGTLCHIYSVCKLNQECKWFLRTICQLLTLFMSWQHAGEVETQTLETQRNAQQPSRREAFGVLIKTSAFRCTVEWGTVWEASQTGQEQDCFKSTCFMEMGVIFLVQIGLVWACFWRSGNTGEMIRK